MIPRHLASSNDVPVLLLNQPNDAKDGAENYRRLVLVPHSSVGSATVDQILEVVGSMPAEIEFFFSFFVFAVNCLLISLI